MFYSSENRVFHYKLTIETNWEIPLSSVYIPQWIPLLFLVLYYVILRHKLEKALELHRMNVDNTNFLHICLVNKLHQDVKLFIMHTWD